MTMLLSRQIVARNPLRLTTVLVGHNKRFSKDVQTNHYDIIIAGGGIVGTTLACTLGKNKKLSNKRVLLLEGSPQNEWKPSPTYSNRVSTLNSGTFKLLNDIDAWKHIEKVRFKPVMSLQVWDSASDAVTTFSNDNVQDIVAQVVENDVVVHAVKEELKTVKNVEIVYQSKVQGCSYLDDKNHMSLQLDNGTSYTCNLLLGCDGANSQVRKCAGIHHVSWNYDQVGVVATLKLQESDENSIAWQRYLPNCEIIALLPLTKDMSSLVWCVSKQRAKELVSLPENKFVDNLNENLMKEFSRDNIIDQAFKVADSLARFMNLPSTSSKQIPPKIIQCEPSSRAGFPLGFGHATNYISKGVALVGDAAHRMHPMAGQGVNLGFGDIVCLNKILGEAVYSGNKMESLTVLKEYETQRQRHNLPIMLAVDGLHRIYNTQFTPFVLLRTLGMQTTHAVKPLKDLFIAQASV